MAKRKKASTQKARKLKEPSGNGVILIIILAMLSGGIYFGWQKSDDGKRIEIPGFTNNFKNRKEESSTYSGQLGRPEKINKLNTQASNPDVIEKEKLNALDGKVEKKKTNAALPKYDEVNNYYFASSFDFGWPAYSQKDAIIEHQYFTLKYNEKTEQADWVAYKLSSKNLANSRFKRNDISFKTDPLVKTKSADPEDYKSSGYDRGHLAPAADFTWSKKGLNETFYMSNVCPQVPGFNRGNWHKLERNIRQWAKLNKEVFIVTGPIHDRKNKKIGGNKVTVPNRFYKIILELQGQNVKGIAFVMDNENSLASLSEFVTSIDEVEKITGLDFFPSLPDDLETKLECCSQYSDWSK